MGCSESEPGEGIIFGAAIERSKLTSFYDQKWIEVNDFAITNQWKEDTENGPEFFYDYTIFYNVTEAGAVTLNWTARSFMLQGKKGVSGQVSLFKKGEAWYRNE